MLSKSLAFCVFAGVLGAAPVVDPFYAGSYSLLNLGSATGVTPLYGGLTTLAGNSNVLLLGGEANGGNGKVFQIGLTRDGLGHITGFSGTATVFSTAPNIDGGLAYGPGDVLFYTGYPTHQIGQIKPGSNAPDRVDTMIAADIGSSLGSIGFIPAGFAAAGQMAVLSYNSNQWRRFTLTADGSGTYSLAPAAGSTVIALSGGLEGVIWVPLGSALFPNPSILVSEYSSGNVVSYELDANGDPIAGTRRVFISGLSGAEGAFLDSVTNDFLFSTFGGGDTVLRVSGFAAPVSTVPEPSALLTAAGALALLAWRRRAA